MLLQILRPLESLAAEIALMRLQRHVDTDVRSDVITFHSSGSAVAPLASEVQIVGALAANMALADVVLSKVSMFANKEYLSSKDVRCDSKPLKHCNHMAWIRWGR